MGDIFPQPELRQLLADIEAAFGGVRLGAGVSLHQARAMDDDWVRQSDVADLRSKDPEERWQDITDKSLDLFSDTLAFMDAEGFRFHIPRFMVYSLTHAGDATGSWAVDAPIYTCMHKDETGRFSLLSPEQRRVIGRFLRLVAAHHHYFADEACQALDQFWGQYG
jgi:hypothetical protein